MRWLALVITGLIIAGAALWALLSLPGPPGHGEIDAASRAELERVIGQAEREAVGR